MRNIIYNIIINIIKEKVKHHLRLASKGEKAEISKADIQKLVNLLLRSF